VVQAGLRWELPRLPAGARDVGVAEPSPSGSALVVVVTTAWVVNRCTVCWTGVSEGASQARDIETARRLSKAQEVPGRG